MRFPIILTVTLLAVGAAGAVAAEAVQPDRLVMPHRTHFEAGVECATCHAGVAESRRARDNLRPGMDICGACHDVADDKGCAMCHTNVDAIGTAGRPAFPAEKFAHAAHLDRNMACAACHGDPAAAAPRLPAKPDCRACHATVDDYGDCRLCHADGADLRPATHGAFWANRHGGQARENEALCATCHTQTTCQACHAGDNVRPRTHPLNFAFDHGIKARGNEQDCASCHGEPEFCSSCHVAERVLPDSHSRAGWVRLPDGGRHAVDGVFEIESCIACHSDGKGAPTCAACHGG